MNSWTSKEGVTFKVGDTITTYYKGVHRLTKIEGRAGNTPLFYFERVLDAKLQPKKGKNCCDAAYCKPFSVADIVADLKKITETYNKAIQLLL